MKLETVDKRSGAATIDPNRVKVGDTGSWTITYELGKRRIETGGEIRVILSPFFGDVQISDPQGRGYVVLSCSNPNVHLRMTIERPWYTERQFQHCHAELIAEADRDVAKRIHSPVGVNLAIRISEGPLVEGDIVVLVYGDMSRGGPGGEIRQWKESRWFEIPIYVDPDGKRKAPHIGLWRIGTLPRVYLEAGPVTKLKVVVPSIVSRQTPVPVWILAYDGLTQELNQTLTDKGLGCTSKWGRLTPHYHGVIEYNGKITEIDETHRGSYRFFTDVNFAQEKYRTITVVDRKNLLIGRSNPMVRRSSGYNLYWGDLHIMNGAFWIPQDLETEDYYDYAKNRVGLDFAAITDICQENYLYQYSQITPKEWESLLRLSRTYYEPGEFVTFPAYEYNERLIGGDKNVYFLSEEEAELLCWSDPRYNSPEKLWEALKGKQAMTIPHHTVSTRLGQNWDYHSPERQRLVEIYSEWGSSEGPGCRRPLKVPTDYLTKSVQHALARGYHLGIIASTDTHSGDVGEAAKAAVWAKDLTREGIWDGLWNRRCYGTTGERIILSFCVNECMMGSTVEHSLDRRDIYVEVVGTNAIEKVEILRNNEVIHVHQGERQYEEIRYQDVQDPGELPLYPLLFYYVRVTQIDGEMAWSSPVWVDLKKTT